MYHRGGKGRNPARYFKRFEWINRAKVLAKKLVQVVSSKEGNSDVPCLKVDLTKPQKFFLMFSSTCLSFNFAFVVSSLHLKRGDTTFISA